MKMSHPRRLAKASSALIAISGWWLASSIGAFPQGQPVECSNKDVKVSVETSPCPGGKIITSARVTNNCPCDASVTVNLPGGGASVFSRVSGNGGSSSDMIRACDQEKGTFNGYLASFSCPNPYQQGSNKQSKPATSSSSSTPDWKTLTATQSKKAQNARQMQLI